MLNNCVYEVNFDGQQSVTKIGINILLNNGHNLAQPIERANFLINSN